MRAKRKRLYILLSALLCFGGATALVLAAFDDSLAFFYAPKELLAAPPGPQQAIRLGGLVEAGTLERAGREVRFQVTDRVESVPVLYSGVLPDLFREGQGVVVEGKLSPNGLFQAHRVLAKHDENYMPKEVAEALRASGEWRPGTGGPANAGSAQ
ncbi:MAG: cytochrome c maturation protein CcmE [Rhodospirillales bacterium]|nr:cytochrome c maturation protein CcmE [Rhodospirillales bacterium]